MTWTVPLVAPADRKAVSTFSANWQEVDALTATVSLHRVAPSGKAAWDGEALGLGDGAVEAGALAGADALPDEEPERPPAMTRPSTEARTSRWTSQPSRKAVQ